MDDYTILISFAALIVSAIVALSAISVSWQQMKERQAASKREHAALLEARRQERVQRLMDKMDLLIKCRGLIDAGVDAYISRTAWGEAVGAILSINDPEMRKLEQKTKASQEWHSGVWASIVDEGIKRLGDIISTMSNDDPQDEKPGKRWKQW